MWSRIFRALNALVFAAGGLTGTLLAGGPASAQTPTTYTYNVHGELVTANEPSVATTYTLDPASNRTGLVATAVTPPTAGPASDTVSANSSNNIVPLTLGGGTTVAVAVVAGSGPSHGTATATGTMIKYTPTGGYTGPDSFNYTASNTCCTSTAATASMTVSP